MIQPAPAFRTEKSLLGAVLLCAASVGCSPSEPDTDDTGSGAAAGEGGLGGTGGAAGSGGATGGAPATGGLASGGAPATGGLASGGAMTGGAAAGGSTGGLASGGSTGGAPATGGGGTGGGVGLVEPIMRAEDSYVLEMGDTVFEVDPTQGARIVTFSKGGLNLLEALTPMTDPDFLNGGSTLWLSPQDSWEGGWPPPAPIDRDPFAVELEGQSIVTTGDVVTLPSGAKWSVSKTFSANLMAEAIDISYRVTNEDSAPASCGLWEVSRHARGGLTFWPGSEVKTGEFTLEAPQDGVIWWEDAASSEIGKVFTDGNEGWIGHVEGDLLLVKTWADGSALAPNHGEVELYLGDGYIELEEHGPFGEVAPQDTATWEIRWHVRQLDASVDVSPGSSALLEMARALAN